MLATGEKFTVVLYFQRDKAGMNYFGMGEQEVASTAETEKFALLEYQKGNYNASFPAVAISLKLEKLQGKPETFVIRPSSEKPYGPGVSEKSSLNGKFSRIC